jgi:enterochelin esterase-like enzyme
MSLDLTSGLLAGLLVVLAVALPVVALGLWPRVRGRALARQAQRWGLLLASQVVAVVAVLVLINNYFGLYSSWDDLLGRTPSGSVAGALDPLASPGRTPSPSGSSPARGASDAPQVAPQVPWTGGTPAGFAAISEPHSFLAQVTVPGNPAPMSLYVSLPAQYFDPAYAHKALPVVELFHGYPGSPTTWYHAMAVLQRLDQATASGGTPFVLVIPQISVPGSPDLECTDLPGQPQVATFLTQEVHQVVTTHFRVRADRAGWGLMGYSEGGYCAAQLLLRHPDLFSAGVSISGYDTPESSYFDAYPALRQAGSLSHLLASRPDVALLASASLQDPQSAGSLTGLSRSARPPTVVKTVVYAQGGHNTSDWSAALPTYFLWLSTRLATLH